MKEVLQILSQHGPFALISGGLIYLIIIFWQKNNELFRLQLESQVADTKAKTELTEALEDLITSVEALGENARLDVGACRAETGKMIGKIDTYLKERLIEKAKEEGRREATDPRFKIPTGDKNDSSR